MLHKDGQPKKKNSVGSCMTQREDKLLKGKNQKGKSSCRKHASPKEVNVAIGGKIKSSVEKGTN